MNKKTLDMKYVRRSLRELINSLMDEGVSPPDIIEGIEKEVSRFETLVFDYE
jgi:hypothetical protein